MKRALRNLFFRIWYWYVSTVDKNAEVIFMNFGYNYRDKKIDMSEKDEPNRYSAQLYHYTASGAEIAGKDVLEVGCGRGGGLSYVNRTFKPKSVTGIDLGKAAIKFNKSYYKEEGGHFEQADAQNLPFKDESFDVVLNVESSHRYPQMELFVSEVKRVLRPGGHLLFIDFRYDHEIDQMHKHLEESGMEILQEVDVTRNVVEALSLATPSRVKLVENLAPKFLHEIGKNFAAVEGSDSYLHFLTRQYVYKYYVLRKI